jgi:hypothetical protein
MRITVKEGDEHCEITVERDGAVHRGLVPTDRDHGAEILELQGDPRILLAAAACWDGLWAEREVTDEELEEQGDGHWAAEAGHTVGLDALVASLRAIPGVTVR